MSTEVSKSATFFQIDAFADRPFSGNPAAVCILANWPEDRWMQQFAAEMNLSETAFLVRRDSQDEHELRWFTPAVEVALCGHATLARAHELWESGRLERAEVAHVITRSGVLPAARSGEWIELDVPATRADPTEAPLGLLEAI